jgi:hypothetical protein
VPATPAPKVTIIGTFDQITSLGKNVYDGKFARDSHRERDNDREWYARTRFRPDFEFAVGRTRAVLGIELDLNYGQTGSNDGGFPGNGTGQACGFSGGCKRRWLRRRRSRYQYGRRRAVRDQVDLHGVRPDRQGQPDAVHSGPDGGAGGRSAVRHHRQLQDLLCER